MLGRETLKQLLLIAFLKFVSEEQPRLLALFRLCLMTIEFFSVLFSLHLGNLHSPVMRHYLIKLIYLPNL